MKPYSWMMALVLLCSTQMAVANYGSACNTCDPCETSCDSGCDWNYDVYADYLYWRIGRSDLHRDHSSEDNCHSCGDYNSGFRVGGALRSDCWDFGVRYTWYQADTKGHGHHHHGLDFEFQAVDLELGYNTRFDCCDINFRPFAGAKFVWVDEKFHGDKVDHKGYGLYLGSEAEWHIADYCDTGVSLVTRGALGILDSRFKIGNHDNCRDCLFNPYLEAFAGLKLTMGAFCGCYSPEILVGYEVQSYSGWRAFDNEEGDRGIGSLGLGGLVVRLGLGF